jgi:UDP-N-acetyl-D-glucosamine dehydrogenase
VSDLTTKLAERAARIVVSGAGYVGLPLALELARAGFHVTALDPNGRKIEAILRGKSYVEGISDADLVAVVEPRRLSASSDPRVLAEADAVVICVPTPLDATRAPDTSYISAALDDIFRYQHPGMLVVLESTTYPGTTLELLAPRLSAGFTLGEDVFVAYSPERTDPGNARHGVRNTPKVVAGVTPACLRAALALYGAIVEQTVPVSSTTAAELVKLLENTFRAVNIGLANELAMLSRRLGVDPFEVVDAASTKPFGFMPFYPGPGVGGHCIPVDPLFLAWKAASLGLNAEFAELADRVNRAMPDHVLRRAAELLAGAKQALRGAKVLVYGMTYKPDIADTRESPGLRIIQKLAQEGADVACMDPLVVELPPTHRALTRVDSASSFSPYDLVVVVVPHRSLDRERLLAEGRLILDTRNVLAEAHGPRAHVHGL